MTKNFEQAINVIHKLFILPHIWRTPNYFWPDFILCGSLLKTNELQWEGITLCLMPSGFQAATSSLPKNGSTLT